LVTLITFIDLLNYEKDRAKDLTDNDIAWMIAAMVVNTKNGN